MLKWLVMGFLGLVGLVVVVAGVGWMLPREHVAASSVVIHQSSDTVWSVLRDLGGVDNWWPEVRRAEQVADPQGREVWRHHLKNGYAMPLVVTISDPPARLVTQIDSSPGSPFGGSWTYEVVGTNGGCRVTVTERGWIANPFFRVMANGFGLHRTMDDYLKHLGQKFGEDVTPVHRN